jgi:ABC-type Fe3+ transport system substrate-binding protein
MGSRFVARLGALVVALVLTACATAPPAQPANQTAVSQTSAPGANPAWDIIVQAAHQEGTLTIDVASSPAHALTDAFQSRYPWIKVEASDLGASTFGPRAITEQRNGLYAWDLLLLAGFNTVDRVLAPADAMGDIRPFLDDLPADVKDDTKWAKGFRWYRNEQSPDSLVTDVPIQYGVWVNRSLIPASQLSMVSQLIDPQFRGKLAALTPAVSSAGSISLATILNSQNDDFIKKVIFDQGLVSVDSSASLAEYVVQGRYPIGIGLLPDALANFQQQGLGKQVEPVREPNDTYVRAAGVSLLKNAPHPNATRVFLAWFLSQEGQQLWNEQGGPLAASRRLDVRVVNPEATPDYSHLSDYKVVFNTPSGDALLTRILDITNKKV